MVLEEKMFSELESLYTLPESFRKDNKDIALLISHLTKLEKLLPTISEQWLKNIFLSVKDLIKRLTRKDEIPKAPKAKIREVPKIKIPKPPKVMHEPIINKLKANKATYKVLIFGDLSVGKKTFLAKSAKRKFEEEIQLTVGVEFYEKEQEIAEKKIRLQIWQYGGEERFRFLLPTYARGANGALFLYDVTNYSSLAHIDDWLLVVRKEMKSEQDTFPIVVVGNKADLLDAREVNGEDGINIAKSREVDGFIECSSKTGENVEEAIAALTRLMMERSGLI